MEFVQPIRDRKQIEAIKKILKASSLRSHVLFVLGINSGLRVSDLLNLILGDVAESKSKVKDRISLREEKTGKQKDFPLSDNAKKALQEYLRTREYEPSAPLFPSRKGGTPLKRAQAWKILNDAARLAGIKERIGTHTLRKTFAYHAYKSGQDITLIQKLLNHSSPAVTLRYIGITQEQMDDVYLTVNL
ncbi:MAG: site-specific integrase [Alicyclobacillus sp.]|nr:site-specific integrase [Alicyclobacillus sp.]